MPPTTTQQTTPQSALAPVQPVTPQTTNVVNVPTTTEQKEDILKRVSQTQPKPVAQDEAPKVSVSMDDIKDPVARQILEKRLADANVSISKTFGEVGADKAKLLKQVEELNQRINQPWTPQRIQQELLARQDFIQSAQSLQAQAAPSNWEGTQEEWSGLSPKDKQLVQNALQGNQMLAQQVNHLLQSQVDSQLKSQYPDYDPTQVDSFYRESLEGRVQPDRIREMIYKALNYDTHVKRAYEFAIQDKTNLNQERVNGMAPNASQATLSTGKPERGANESSTSWLSKVTKWNLEQVAKYRANQR